MLSNKICGHANTHSCAFLTDSNSYLCIACAEAVANGLPCQWCLPLLSPTPRIAKAHWHVSDFLDLIHLLDNFQKGHGWGPAMLLEEWELLDALHFSGGIFLCAEQLNAAITVPLPSRGSRCRKLFSGGRCGIPSGDIEAIFCDRVVYGPVLDAPLPQRDWDTLSGELVNFYMILTLTSWVSTHRVQTRGSKTLKESLQAITAQHRSLRNLHRKSDFSRL
jgi:hypothetical protein